MAKRSKNELLEQVKAIIGDDTSDNALNLLSDISDTIDEYEKGTNGDGEDWKKKYEENDAQWRQKYKDRFFNKEVQEEDKNDPRIDDTIPQEKKTKFEDLFERKEN